MVYAGESSDGGGGGESGPSTRIEALIAKRAQIGDLTKYVLLDEKKGEMWLKRNIHGDSVCLKRAKTKKNVGEWLEAVARV